MQSREDINSVILFQIDKTSKIAKQHAQREFDRLQLGITIEQWILLKIIEESKELSQKELAVKSLRDPASITRTLDILEKKGLIRRAALDNNRRQYNIILTSEGKAFVDQNMNTVEEERRKSIEGFSYNELKKLESMLLRIQENMR